MPVCARRHEAPQDRGKGVPAGLRFASLALPTRQPALSSVAGLLGGHPSLLYPVSKSAVVGLTRTMAAHRGASLIRVNCIAPGRIYTPMVAVRGMPDEMRQARRLFSPLQTEGSAWDVAMAAVFLAGDEARWITGVVLPVDAGATAGQSESPVPRSDAR